LSTNVPAQAFSAQLSLSTATGSTVSNGAFYVVPNGVTCLNFDFISSVSLNGQFGGTIAPNDCAIVTFVMNAGQKIDLSTTFTPNGNVIYLQAPDGTQLNQENLLNGQDDIADTLPLTGNYFALIVNQAGSPLTINGYLYDNTDKLYSIDALNPITITTHYGQTARVQFAGTNNTHITLHATNITYPPVNGQFVLPASFSDASGGPIVAMSSQDQTEADNDLVFFQNDNYTMVIGPTPAAGSAYLQLLNDTNFGSCNYSLNEGPTITTAAYEYCVLSFNYTYPPSPTGIDIIAGVVPGEYNSYYKGCNAAAVAPDGSWIPYTTGGSTCPWFFEYSGQGVVLVFDPPLGTYTILFGDAAGARCVNTCTATMGAFFPPF
jgi:hypothetical protein